MYNKNEFIDSVSLTGNVKIQLANHTLLNITQVFLLRHCCLLLLLLLLLFFQRIISSIISARTAFYQYVFPGTRITVVALPTSLCFLEILLQTPPLSLFCLILLILVRSLPHSAGFSLTLSHTYWLTHSLFLTQTYISSSTQRFSLSLIHSIIVSHTRARVHTVTAYNLVMPSHPFVAPCISSAFCQWPWHWPWYRARDTPSHQTKRGKIDNQAAKSWMNRWRHSGSRRGEFSESAQLAQPLPHTHTHTVQNSAQQSSYHPLPYAPTSASTATAHS